MEAEAAFTDGVVLGDTNAGITSDDDENKVARIRRSAVIGSVSKESLKKDADNGNGRYVVYDAEEPVEAVTFIVFESHGEHGTLQYRNETIEPNDEWVCAIKLKENNVRCSRSTESHYLRSDDVSYNFRYTTRDNTQYVSIGATGNTPEDAITNAYQEVITEMNDRIAEQEDAEERLDAAKVEAVDTIESLDLKSLREFSDVDW